MAEQQTVEKVNNVLFGAIIPVVNQIKEEEGPEALALIGPTLLTGGILMLIAQTGNEVAAQVVGQLADSIKRGDFDKSLGAFSGLFH